MTSTSPELPEGDRSGQEEITSLLLAWRGGDSRALALLMPMVYRRLKRIARRMLRSHSGHQTLQTTALVHEAYLRIIDLDRLSWQDRAHFFAMSARLMRRILVDHARQRERAKRGGGEPLLVLNELTPVPVRQARELLELHEALRELARADPQLEEIVELRFFGGLNRDEIAEVLELSSATVTRRWRSARTWLATYLKRPLP